MKYYYEAKKKIPIIDIADVLVVGGGTTGVVASIAAARNNSRVVLIERMAFLGGMLTGQMLNHISSFHDFKMNKIIGGIPQEIIDRLIKINGSQGHIKDTTGYSSTLTPIDHEKLKYLLDTMVLEAGVNVLMQTLCVNTIVEKGILKGIIIENKCGRSAIMAKVVIDCSGDADVAYMSKATLQKEDNSSLKQAISLLFKLGNINVKKVLHYYEENFKDFRKGSQPRSQIDTKKNITLWGFGSLLKKGYREGVLSIDRKEIHVSILPKERIAIINATRFCGGDNNIDSLSLANIVLRKQIIEFLNFFNRYVPGFKDAYLLATANMLGVRETRRILGEYILKDNDVIEGRTFSDSISRSCFPCDLHDSSGSSMVTIQVKGSVGIPYRCLIPLNIENLIVAGRCISATRIALSSVRMTASCMAMGQAAGTAAALSIQEKESVRKIKIIKLQYILKNQVAII